MFLLRRRIRGRSIEHPLSTWCSDKLDHEQLASLAVDLQNGVDRTSELLRAHMKLAIKIASQYAAIHPYHNDDLVSEAVIGMLTACKRIKNKEMVDDNVTGFFVSCINGAIKAFIRRNAVVRVPESSKKHYKSKGVDVGVVISKIDYTVPDRDTRKPIELLEVLDKIANDDFDRDVVALKAQGYTIKEISDKLKVSQTKVFLSKAKMEQRYANFSTV